MNIEYIIFFLVFLMELNVNSLKKLYEILHLICDIYKPQSHIQGCP